MKPTDMLKIWNAISRRWLYLAGAAVVGVIFCAALFMQYVLREDPCPLCMVQRVVFIVIGVWFIIAAIHNAKQIGARGYSVLIAVTAMIGVGVSSRHIWIQHLPKDEVPACGPGLDFMLKHFPMSEVWQELMHGSGECAAKGWTFLTFGLPEWALAGYVFLGVFAVLIGWKKG